MGEAHEERYFAFRPSKVFAYKLKRLTSSSKPSVSKCLLVAMNYRREELVSKWLSLDGL